VFTYETAEQRFEATIQVNRKPVPYE